MTPANQPPPFVVELYDGNELISRYEFLTHDEAVTVAIKALRDAHTLNMNER
jgi:hypothetical protein